MRHAPRSSLYIRPKVYSAFKPAKACAVALLSGTVGLAPWTYAAELPAFTEEDLIADIPMVVSATRRNQKLTEAPASITIIDREQIEASGAINITDVFRLVPGMQAYHVTRNKFAVAYHGVSDDFPNRMEVMVDGRSIYLPLLSTVAWETIGIELDDISHIEVVRGSNVPTQGSNAFLGSINIVTRSALSPERSNVQVMTGNRGEKRVEMRHSLLAKNGYIRLAGGYSQNDGSEIFEEDAHKSFLNLNASTTLSLQDTLDIRAGFSTGQYDVVGADLLTQSAVPRDHNSHYQHVTWSHAATDESEFKLSFYHNYLKLHVDAWPADRWLARELEIPLAYATPAAELYGIDGTYLRPDSEHGRVDLYDIELQHTYYPNESLSLTSGAGYRFERALSDTLLDSTEWISEEHLRLFGNLQWNQTTQAIWNLGAMYEASSLATSQVSPRAAFNYLLDEDTSVRVAHTLAYRMPSLLEHNSAFNIRQNEANNFNIAEQVHSAPESLKAERVTSSEIGLYSHIPQYDTHFDLRLFHEKIKGGIDSYFIEADSSYSDLDNRRITRGNAQHWETNGIEGQVKVRPTNASLLVLNYGLVNVSGSYDRGLKSTLDLAEYAPRHTASLLLSYTPANDWQIAASHYFMSATRWLEGTGTGKPPRKAYQRTDVQVKKAFALTPSTDAEVRFIIQNLFNDRYQEFYEYNFFDRRAYAEVKLLF